MLMNDKDAAKYLGLSVHTLRQWRINPARTIASPPPFVKMGHAIRYKREDLDEWIAQNTHGGSERDAA